VAPSNGLRASRALCAGTRTCCRGTDSSPSLKRYRSASRRTTRFSGIESGVHAEFRDGVFGYHQTALALGLVADGGRIHAVHAKVVIVGNVPKKARARAGSLCPQLRVQRHKILPVAAIYGSWLICVLPRVAPTAAEFRTRSASATTWTEVSTLAISNQNRVSSFRQRLSQSSFGPPGAAPSRPESRCCPPEGL